MRTVLENLNQFSQKDVSGTLKKEFKEAMKYPGFQELVSKIPLPEEELMKYTSSLEESVKEYENAMATDSIVTCKNKVKGYIYYPIVVDNRLEFSYIPAPYQKEINKRTAHLSYVTYFDMPEELKMASMAEVYVKDANRMKIIKWMDRFIEQYPKNPKQKGLYLHGSFGSGKTYLISAMFNELAKLGYKSAIIFWPEYLRNLKAGFQDDFKERFNRVKKVPLLLLDDIGAENNTEWGRDEILCTILQYRMQEGLPTFFTSNLDIPLLTEHLSITKERVSEVKALRIIERIKQLTEEEVLISQNLRK